MTRCAVCEEEGNWQLHHPTARDHQRRYLDPDFAIPLCHDHHTLAGDDLNTLGLAVVDRRLTLVESVILRLRRLAAALARVDHARGEGTLWGSMAAALSRWADDLAVAVAEWDRLDPGWRRLPGFYPDAAR